MRLVILDRRGLGFGIEMWRHPTDHFNRPHTMCDGHHRIAINALARGPLPPLAVDGLS